MELIRMYDTNEDVLVAKKSVVGVEEGRCYSAKWEEEVDFSRSLVELLVELLVEI